MRGIFQGLYLASRSLSRTCFVTVKAQKPIQGFPYCHYLVEVSKHGRSKNVLIFLLKYSAVKSP